MLITGNFTSSPLEVVRHTGRKGGVNQVLKGSLRKFMSTFIFTTFLYLAAFSQSPDFTFTTGQLFIDPENGDTIHSPYLHYQSSLGQEWMVYDPFVKEGRFQSVAASYSGAVTCGYITGDLRIGGKVFRANSSLQTGVVFSFGFDKLLQWSYLHRSSLKGSRFMQVEKLADGRALVSGYEYENGQDKPGDNDRALLLCLNREGKIDWALEIPGARGYEVRRDGKRVCWQVAKKEGKRHLVSVLYQIDRLDGTVARVLEEQGDIYSGELTFSHTTDGGLVTARSLDNATNDLSVSRYDAEGRVVWSVTAGSGDIIPGGIIENPAKPNDFRLAVNARGTVIIDGQETVSASEGRETSLALISISGDGTIYGYEHYSDAFTRVNGIFRSENKMGLVGSHRGDIRIHHNDLKFDDNHNDLEQAYTIYLSESVIDEQTIREDIAGRGVLHDINQLVIHPNPVSGGVVTLSAELENVESSCQVVVYDGQGYLQASYVKMPVQPSFSDQINVGRLASGLYHVYLIQRDQIVAKGKLIISK